MSRIFIIEPSLILRTGHVKKCTELFALEALELNRKVVVVVPIASPSILSEISRVKVIKALPNTYEHILYNEKLFPTTTKIFVRIAFLFFPRKRQDQLIRFIDRATWYFKNRAEMKRTLRQLFKNEKIGPEDKLVLPNGDLICSMAIIRMIQHLGKTRAPKLAIRFINVMENVGVPYLISKKLMFRKLRLLENREFSLNISSETENYRLYISKYLRNSNVCEYPSLSKKNRKKRSNQIVIGILGSARPDKGFEQLDRIIPIVKSQSSTQNTHFIVQGSTFSWGKKYDEILDTLRRFSLTKLLPGYISQQEMDEVINSCTALLLPYDAETYTFRGSAMLFDAADLKIPVIVPAATGMGSTVRRFGIGATYSNISEIPLAIQFVADLTQEEINTRFKIYNDFRNSGIRKFLE